MFQIAKFQTFQSSVSAEIAGPFGRDVSDQSRFWGGGKAIPRDGRGTLNIERERWSACVSETTRQFAGRLAGEEVTSGE